MKALQKYTDWFTSVFKLGSIIKRLVKDVWPGHERAFAWLMILTVSGSVLPILSSFLYSRVIGSLSDKTFGKTMFWFWLSIGLTIGLVVLKVVTQYIDRITFNRFQMRFQTLYFKNKSQVDIGVLEQKKTHDLVSKAQDRGTWSMTNIVDQLPNAVASAVGLISSVIVVAWFDWRLAALICASLIPQFLVDVWYGRVVWGIWDGETEERRHFEELNRYFFNRSPHIEIRLLDGVRHFLGSIEKMLLSFRVRQEKAERKRHILSFCTSIFGSGAIVAVLFVAIQRVIGGSVEIRTFIFVWGSIIGLHGTFSGLLSIVAQMNSMALYADDLYKVMALPKESDTKKGTIEIGARIPTIEFRNVWFRYPGADDDRWVLKNASFTLRPGEKIALVGINGSGKTTIVRLLANIYEPTLGEILVDGVRLQDISIGSWRKNLAILFQEYTNFHATVRDAISYGAPSEEPTDERINEAVRVAGCTFIDDLPKGLDTMIGRDFEGGMDLSGGQRQRTALARIWYRKAMLVILDEPTASLDAFAEAEIFSEIERRPKTETVLLITHRMSSVKNAEHIIVINDGTVVEEGKHSELISRKGVYRDMFLSQAKAFIE